MPTSHFEYSNILAKPSIRMGHDGKCAVRQDVNVAQYLKDASQGNFINAMQGRGTPASDSCEHDLWLLNCLMLINVSAGWGGRAAIHC